MAIVNIRGTNGSGKSSIVHALLGGDTHRNVIDTIELAPYLRKSGKPTHVVGYRLKDDTVVIGPYRTQCGGCDAIPQQELVCESVRMAAKLSRRVVFEGIIVSDIFQRYADLAREMKRRRRLMIFAFMSTPFEECIRRIKERNGGKPFDEDTVHKHYNVSRRVRERFTDEGFRVEDLPWRRVPTAKVRRLLEES